MFGYLPILLLPSLAHILRDDYDEPREDRYPQMTKVALVPCAKGKVESSVAARDLYDSELFRKSRRWAEHNADSWFILSALT